MNASAPDLERKTLDLAVVADHAVTDQDGSAGALPECWSPAAQPDDHVEIIGTPAPPTAASPCTTCRPVRRSPPWTGCWGSEPGRQER